MLKISKEKHSLFPQSFIISAALPLFLMSQITSSSVLSEELPSANSFRASVLAINSFHFPSSENVFILLYLLMDISFDSSFPSVL